MKADLEQRLQLKGSCQNAVAISCMLLADEENERLLNIISCVLRKALTFQVAHFGEHKSSELCRSWILGQATGAYFNHLKEIIGIISDTSLLEQAGLTVSPVRVSALLQRANEGEIQTEDEYSDALGQLVFEFLTEREDRGLWLLRGWPWAQLRGFHSQNAFIEVLQDFQSDLQVWNEVQAYQAKTAALELLIQRSVFQKASVKQLELAVQDCFFVVSSVLLCFVFCWFVFCFAMNDQSQDPDYMSEQWQADFKKLGESRMKRAVPTLIVESMFGVQKAHKCLRMSKRARRPERSFGSVLRAELIGKVHKWRTPNILMPLGSKDVFLNPECWHQPPRTRSLSFNSVVSTKPAAPYYSPASNCYTQHVADLELLRILKKDHGGEYSKVDGAFLSLVFIKLTR